MSGVAGKDIGADTQRGQTVLPYQSFTLVSVLTGEGQWADWWAFRVLNITSEGGECVS